MSNHAYRGSKPRKSGIGLAISVAFLLIVLILFLNFRPRAKTPANWHISQAHLLGTRITVQGLLDADQARPAEIYYRGEAHVTYTADGKQYDQWLPATDTTDDRNSLVFYMSKRSSKTVQVKWNPDNPSQGAVTLRIP